VTWLAVLLIGVAATDFAHSVRPSRVLDEAVGAGVTLVVGLLAGLTGPLDLVALLVLAGVAVLWGETVTQGFGRARPWLPLLVLGVAVLLTILFSGAAGSAGGPLGWWLDRVDVPVLGGLDPERFLVLVAAFLVQLSTGNVVVRLVLAATGTVNPAHHGQPDDPELRLKGGRLLGPMERVFILGLGLAGYLTAASIVIAAKGLLRFPELRSEAEQTRIHQLTEYFLVGSFVSWLVALTSLVVLGH
jgi:hypothetical protein